MAQWSSEACPLPDEQTARDHLLQEFPCLQKRDDVLQNVMGVYTKVLQAERGAEEDRLDLVRTRLVGYFILYSPTPKALVAFVDELRSIAGGAEAFKHSCYRLGDEVLEQFVRPFRVRRCDQITRTVVGTDYPSILVKTNMKELLEEAPHDASYARLAALFRDCYRCQVTRTVDYDTFTYKPQDRERKHLDGRVGITEPRHIIPDFDYDPCPWKDSPLRNELQWKFWERFGHPELRGELSGRIHRPENVVTLRLDICEMVDDLQLCLKPVQGKIGTFDIFVFGRNATRLKEVRGIPDRRTFHLNAAVDIPKPELKYFRILATCCFIANLSGAMEYNDVDSHLVE
ncbi:hypothetical protein OH76DRAFT_1486938 [Lentinus brumalis]|uniref:HNH nuclease domain-containing protein n=1 Tax=Lentinus brumalis TaxID=2498619 RepID=A0A371CWJ0_9APHY|nr:hypothetical protein OH76DRAFT_1486938 [Polyporus brumalis]